jgi:hypothetical protein
VTVDLRSDLNSTELLWIFITVNIETVEIDV